MTRQKQIKNRKSLKTKSEEIPRVFMGISGVFIILFSILMFYFQDGTVSFLAIALVLFIFGVVLFLFSVLNNNK